VLDRGWYEAPGTAASVARNSAGANPSACPAGSLPHGSDRLRASLTPDGFPMAARTIGTIVLVQRFEGIAPTEGQRGSGWTQFSATMAALPPTPPANVETRGFPAASAMEPRAGILADDYSAGLCLARDQMLGGGVKLPISRSISPANAIVVRSSR
jgi:hypothetical protein